MKHYQTSIIAAVLLLWSFLPAMAQIGEAKIGVNGLTCSLCVRSVEKSIRELDFVDSVRMNLSQTEGTIYFRKSEKISLNALAEKVVDAGFSVRSMEVEIDFSRVKQIGDHCFQIGDDLYIFAEGKKSPKKGFSRVILIGENFLTKKEYKKRATVHPNGCNPDELKVENTYFILL